MALYKHLINIFLKNAHKTKSKNQYRGIPDRRYNAYPYILFK